MEAVDSRGRSLDNYHALVLAFSEFLTVAVHTILFERDIYPQESFIKARKYNFPVRQNRHPKVCAWIQDAVAAVEAEMMKCTVAQTSMVIFSKTTNVPLERYVFCTDAFPVVPAGDIRTSFEKAQIIDPVAPNEKRTPPTIDLTAQFPGVISRLSTLSDRLRPLPKGCAFTIAIELRDQPVGISPIGWSKPWIPSEPGLQPSDSTDRSMDGSKGLSSPSRKSSPRATTSQGQYLGGVRTTPVRTVEAGHFMMEVWVEEGKEKMSIGEPSTASDT